MNLLQRRLIPLVVSTALTIVPIAVHGQDAASAKATFDAVNKRLDLGGQFYAFLNVDGDFTQLATKAQELYEQLQTMDGFDAPPGLDIAGFLGELGLDNLDAIGLSSIQFDQGYRNRFFAAIDGPRTGLLRLWGGAPKAFEIGNFAPAAAAAATEWDLDLAGIKDLITGIGGQMQRSMGMDPLSGVLQQPVPGTEINVSQLIDALKGTVMLYVLIDEEKNLDIPDPGAPEIPGIDLVVAHSNGTEVFGHFKSFVTSNAPPDAFTLTEMDDATRIQLHIPPEASLGFYAPLVQVNKETGQLLIASRPEALQSLEGDRLATNPDFKRTAALLPSAGSGYSYVSPAIYRFMDIFTEAAAQGSPGIAKVQADLMALVYGKPQVMAGMWSNEEDGVYSESITPMSYKLSLAYVAIVPMAISAAVIAPMAGKARMRAREVEEIRANDAAEEAEAEAVRQF